MPPEATRTMQSEMFGRQVRFDYSEHWVGWSILALRIVMGWTLLWAGIDKLRDGLDGLQPKWTADGFLTFAVHADNPFKDMFADMAGATTDFLVVWGLTLTGLCLVLGFVTRFAAFWGAVIMLMFWLAAWQGWFKLEHGWVVDEHIVYAVLLFGLGAFGAGRVFGLDVRIERMAFVVKNQWLKWFLA